MQNEKKFDEKEAENLKDRQVMHCDHEHAEQAFVQKNEERLAFWVISVNV